MNESAPLLCPVGVFDAGIGSYDLVRRLRRAYPSQDVIYLADRASFPYGAKGESELLASVTRACEALVSLGAASIVLASNAPSVTVLDRLRPLATVPVIGVAPPVREALVSLPADGVLAVAGARVMVESEALRRLIQAEAGPDASRVVPVAADALIALVENGAFLELDRVRGPVGGFAAGLRAAHPALAGITLSSTHLPWLARAFREVAPELALFDPADGVVTAFGPLAALGSGRLVCVATESPEHPLAEFEAMISALGLSLEPELIEIP